MREELLPARCRWTSNRTCDGVLLMLIDRPAYEGTPRVYDFIEVNTKNLLQLNDSSRDVSG